MQDIYYRSLDLEADMEMVQMVADVKEDDRFELIKEPDHVLVHEMGKRTYERNEYGRFEEKYEETGTHEGYYWHYFVFRSKRTGIEYHVNKSTYYPFDGKWGVSVDRKWIGEWNGLEVYA